MGQVLGAALGGCILHDTAPHPRLMGRSAVLSNDHFYCFFSWLLRLALTMPHLARVIYNRISVFSTGALLPPVLNSFC